jgi:hypothetical protein
LGEDRNIFKSCCVEQTDESEATETENRSVGGSIPPLGTMKINNLVGTTAIRKIAVSAQCPH